MAPRSRPAGTKELGTEYLALRESTGLNQKEFGKILGHGRELIGQIEKGVYSYYPDELHKIHEYINQPILCAPTTKFSFITGCEF